MISVLTLTYQRHHLLEEAIQSFLLQNNPNSEMVVINDSPNNVYTFNHPQVKIFNLKERFTSISKKLEWGFSKCSYDYIYRLDDDDLLGPDALNITEGFINANPGYEIYRPKTHYFFIHNKFDKIGGNVNNGNVYTKNYINRIQFPDKSFGEDFDITFKNNAKIYEDNGKPTMIYRWGMNTYHVSGFGEIQKEIIYKKIDEMTKNNLGNFELKPKFNSDYYKMINYI
jgi:cellulose synthase/poly-beta-1,6-N-acetylglucosamine synthase-like glycosyltransferase